MAVKLLFTKKLNCLLNELFGGDFEEFQKHIPLGEKTLKRYLDENYSKNKNYPTAQFINIVKNNEKNHFFRDIGLTATDFKNITRLNEFKKKIAGIKEVYFNTKDIIGKYIVTYNNKQRGIIEIHKFKNDKYTAKYYINNKEIKSFYFEVLFHQVFMKFKSINNDVISFDLYKPTNNKDILIGTLQGLDIITHLPYSEKVSLIKDNSEIKIWSYLTNLKEKITFYESDIKPTYNKEERKNHYLLNFEKNVDYFIERIMFFKNYFNSEQHNFYYMYILDDIRETLEKQKEDYTNNKSYSLRGNIETGKKFFKYIDNYVTMKNSDIECYLITTPVSNFKKSIYDKSHIGQKEYQQLSLNLANKIKKINRIFMIDNRRIFNHVKDILIEQYQYNINIYICNDLSLTNYTEVAYTSRKKHILYIRKNNPRSLSQVSQDISLIDDIDIEFKKIIDNQINTKKLDYFLEGENNFDYNKIKKFFKNKN